MGRRWDVPLRAPTCSAPAKKKKKLKRAVVEDFKSKTKLRVSLNALMEGIPAAAMHAT